MPPRPRPLLSSRLLKRALPILFAVLAALLVATTEGIAGRPTTRASLPEQELVSHRERLGVTRWMEAGYLGRGVKIAVLDADFSGWTAELGETLPTRVKAKSFRADGNLEAGDTRHGLRAAQVIHALAPRAELLFANWEPSSPVRFLEAVRWAQKEGARIISCSITAAGWGDGEGGGPIHRKLTRLIGKGDQPDDLLFVCSAGNMIRGHWGGAFARSTDRLHQWKTGQLDNALSPDGKAMVKVNLLHRPGAVYELLLYEKTGKEPLSRVLSETDASVPGNWISFTPKAGLQYRVRLRHVGGRLGTFHLVARGGSLDLTTRENSVCCFPADNPAVLTVGASDWNGRRASYSAYGTATGRTKPELVAPVPFPCPDKPDGFHGTSAAAPQVAALAALLRNRNPDWTAHELRQSLLTASQPPGKRGISPQVGHGRLSLPLPR